MEFETLYKQTFAQVRCPARVAVAAQPAPRRRFGWVICLAAPLLLAAGVLARVEFTNLHNTPHPSYAPDAVGGLRDYPDPAILHPGRPAFVALGDNKLRVELLQKLTAAGYATPVFISDAASVSPSAVLEPGCIIMPRAYVGAGVHLGVGCIVNAGAIVDHDAALGRGVHVAPGGIVKAGAEVAEYAKVDSGEVVRSPWEGR